LVAYGAGLSLLLAGCTTPIGADRVTTKQSYAQVNASALRTGKPGADTVSILHRLDLDRLAARQPDEAVRPATAMMRGPTSLAELTSGKSVCPLELYSGLSESTVTIGTSQLPLENDLTTYRAYNLNQSTIWKLGKLDFLAPGEHIPNQLILHEPFVPKRVPVVFVHGTFSSPVTWAEMANTLTADPVLRDRYQAWSFIYGSGNPLVKSIADLRTALMEQVERLDPDGTNTTLRQMVVLGHSQGGLLTKGTAVDNGDLLWRMVSTNRFEDVKLDDPERAEVRRLLFYKPLPFVSRVVFIATPHRGSYLSGGLARRIGRRIVSLPGDLVSSGKAFSPSARARKPRTSSKAKCRRAWTACRRRTPHCLPWPIPPSHRESRRTPSFPFWRRIISPRRRTESSPTKAPMWITWNRNLF
jgi:pimeloyl-ACP methyl ester carboxylesterase